MKLQDFTLLHNAESTSFVWKRVVGNYTYSIELTENDIPFVVSIMRKEGIF